MHSFKNSVDSGVLKGVENVIHRPEISSNESEKVVARKRTTVLPQLSVNPPNVFVSTNIPPCKGEEDYSVVCSQRSRGWFVRRSV